MSELKPEEMRVRRFGAIRSWLRPKYGLFDLNPLGPDHFFRQLRSYIWPNSVAGVGTIGETVDWPAHEKFVSTGP